MQKPLFYDLTISELKDILKEKGLTPFAAQQVYDWVYRKKILSMDEWTNVSKKVKAFLSEDYDFTLPEIVWNALSTDGTRKFLVKMRDGNTVETVAIPAKNRLTLCISSQVGCAIGCTFCHTGTQGLTRHLTGGEITGQFMTVSLFLRENVHPDEKLTNIVYMGQGEPLHNYENVKKATENFIEVYGLALGQRRITLSTSGLVPKIKMLGDFPPINIAISLHAAHDNIRTELMPINKVYDLKRLFEAIKEIPLKAHRRITYEYLLIDGFNDRMEDIVALEELLHLKESKINLIPFNEYPGSEYKKPSKKKVLWFMEQMCSRGFTCTIRATKGDDILAACGQLKSEYETPNLWDSDLKVVKKPKMGKSPSVSQ